MFVGHYGPSLAIRAVRPEVPLWVLFVAAQLVDIAWAMLVLGGIEKLRIVPGITTANPLDLYYMPYTHSLVAALPPSPAAVAASALGAYLVFAAVAGWIDRLRVPIARG